MFDRFAASFALARSSWDVLRTDKQLIVFPIVSGIGCFLVMLGFVAPFLVHPEWLKALDVDNGARQPAWVWVVAFAYYFCNYFVVIFCNSALISCALIRFNGGEPTLADGFRAAMARLPQILAWALVSATVGLALKAIENAHEKAGRFISSLLGTAWTIMTYFVVPVLVVEQVGPFAAIGRSMSILKKTWGEALIGNFGVGFFLFLLLLPAILLGIIGAVLCGTVLPVGIALLLIAAIYFLLWMAVGSALHGIFVGALYQYASRGEVPSGFERGNLSAAFAHKS